MALSEASSPVLASWLATALGADEARIATLERLGGGAIQENWALDVELMGGSRAGHHALVLRTDAPTRVAVSWNRIQEYRILEAAHGWGHAMQLGELGPQAVRQLVTAGQHERVAHQPEAARLALGPAHQVEGLANHRRVVA